MARANIVFVIAVGLGCTPVDPERASLRRQSNGWTMFEPVSIVEPEPRPKPADDAQEAEPTVEQRLMKISIYTPDPDIELLRQTKAADDDELHGRATLATLAFCVEVDGVTSDIQTLREVPGDLEVDRILRDTIATWRFKPIAEAGFPRRVCTKTNFLLRFER